MPTDRYIKLCLSKNFKTNTVLGQNAHRGTITTVANISLRYAQMTGNIISGKYMWCRGVVARRDTTRYHSTPHESDCRIHRKQCGEMEIGQFKSIEYNHQQKKATTWQPFAIINYTFNYYSFGPASTNFLPAGLLVNLTKFLMKRSARSRALTSHSLAVA